jgi:hypothetical protein
VPEIVTSDIFPQRKEHPNVNDQFVQLSAMAGNGPSGANQGSGAVNTHSDSNLRTSRILVEVGIHPGGLSRRKIVTLTDSEHCGEPSSPL